MERVKVELEHCYGIKKLEAEFDFQKKRAYAIYAPDLLPLESAFKS